MTSEPALLPTPNKGLPHFPRTDPIQDPNPTTDPGPDLVHSTTLDNASDADPAPYPDETANLYPRATKTDSSIIALKAKESKSQ